MADHGKDRLSVNGQLEANPNQQQIQGSCAGEEFDYMQQGFWNPRYVGSAERRLRSNTLSVDGAIPKPEVRPRRTMSVSTRTNPAPPKPRPRALTSHAKQLKPRDPNIEVESTYSTPWSNNIRRRISSVSSSSSSLSSASSCSSPSSPTSNVSPEQFWAKYKRTSEARNLRSLFCSLSLVETPSPTPVQEPIYAEIYGSKDGVTRVQPPLPRKNSISKPPARPPYPASSINK